MGGDRARAEALFQRALELDPHQTGGRLELARLYVNSRRWVEAQRELQRILDERTPTDMPRWTMSDRPRARTLLSELYQQGRVTTPAEAP
jgi:predicted Zn-dependent protease